MARQILNLGSAPNDGTGTDLRAGGDMINDNFIELYNSGAWTPVLEGATTAGTFTYATQDGYYTNIGETVIAFFNINTSAEPVAAVGNMQISGLPFSAASSTSDGLLIEGWSGINLAAGYTFIGARISSGTSIILLRKSGDNVALATLPDTEFGTAVVIAGAFIYRRAI